MGLAIASDIGIALQTMTIAVMLHEQHMVSLASLDYAEMGRCGGGGPGQRRRGVGHLHGLLEVLWRTMGRDLAASSRWVDFAILLAGRGALAGDRQMGARQVRIDAAPRGHEAAPPGIAGVQTTMCAKAAGVDGKYSRPTHRDKAAMNGAQTYIFAKLSWVAGSVSGPPAPNRKGVA